MKIVVIGGSGLVGSKLVAKLGAQGHEAVAASPNSGVIATSAFHELQEEYNDEMLFALIRN